LVEEALRYKPKGRVLDSRWCHWKFWFTESFRPHCGNLLNSASNKNEYQEYFLGGKGDHCVGVILQPSRAPYSSNPQGLSKSVEELLYVYRGKLFAEATPRLIISLYHLYATKVRYEPVRIDMYGHNW
jgi:hypothetical protein